MLANLPDETTQLLIDICTGSPPASTEIDNTPGTPAGKGSYLSYLALNRGQASAPDSIPPPSPTSTARPIEEAKASQRRQGSVIETPRTASPAPPSILTAKPKPEKKTSPRQYFSHFVDNNEKFVVFLEAVALHRWSQSVDESPSSNGLHAETVPPLDEEADKLDQIAVWNTLLELYLTLSQKEGEKSPLRGKALRLLQSETIPYGPTHALILCSTRGFTPGLVLLWEKLGMYEDILRFWIDQEKEGQVPGASAQVLRYLDLYGPQHPHLYPLVLRFLTSSPHLLSRHTEELERILECIDKEKIMPPLGVIQVLSRNDVTSVGLVKQWLLSRIKESDDEIQAVRSLFLLQHEHSSLTYFSVFLGSPTDQLVS